MPTVLSRLTTLLVVFAMAAAPFASAQQFQNYSKGAPIFPNVLAPYTPRKAPPPRLVGKVCSLRWCSMPFMGALPTCWAAFPLRRYTHTPSKLLGAGIRDQSTSHMRRD